LEVVIKLTALVESSQTRNRTRHEVGTIVCGEPVALSKVPNPSKLMIIEEPDGVFLLYLDSEGEVMTNTWHESIQLAMQQAEFEFGVMTENWATMG